jgi:hypothetical protein
MTLYIELSFEYTFVPDCKWWKWLWKRWATKEWTCGHPKNGQGLGGKIT